MAETAADEHLSEACEAMWNASEASQTEGRYGNALEGRTAVAIDGPWAEMAWCLYSTMRWDYLP